MKILFITSSRIGDAVLSTGLLNYIMHRYPEASPTIVCGPLVTSLFEGVPQLDRVISLKKQKHNKHWISLWTDIVKVKWDIVVDLRDSAVSRLIVAKERYIFSRHIDKTRHKVEQAAAVMGLKEIPSPVIFTTDAQKQAAKAFIPEGTPVIGVGPAANWPGKMWLTGRFIDLIKALRASDGILPDARVAVFAAPGEEDVAYNVLKAFPKPSQIDVIAKTDPGTAAATLSRCDFYVGNDSGLMHCAAAAGVPTVGVFGPSYPHLYRPWGKHTAYISTPESYDELTSYDGYHPDNVKESLMGSLTLDDVIACCNEFWSKTQKS